jgi:hypothetical protein
MDQDPQMNHSIHSADAHGVPQHKIFVGTFHKSGTVLMDQIWTQACQALGIGLWKMNDMPAEPKHSWQVAFNYKSTFGDIPGSCSHRGMLVIRDPRDVIISGMHYHRKSEESWLHVRREQFGGLTYQEKINSLETDEERLLFEMENQGRKTIKGIIRAMEAHPDFYCAKLERLVEDRELAEYRGIFSFLGFEGDALAVLLDAARGNSLFAAQPKLASHVRSGRPGLWLTEFTPRVMEVFVSKYANLPQTWGYPAP